jgi:hypothetical protein
VPLSETRLPLSVKPQIHIGNDGGLKVDVSLNTRNHPIYGETPNETLLVNRDEIKLDDVRIEIRIPEIYTQMVHCGVNKGQIKFNHQTHVLTWFVGTLFVRDISKPNQGGLPMLSALLSFGSTLDAGEIAKILWAPVVHVSFRHHHMALSGVKLNRLTIAQTGQSVTQQSKVFKGLRCLTRTQSYQQYV